MNKVSVFGFDLNKDGALNFFLFAFAIAVFAMSNPAFAAGGLGGLDNATEAVMEIIDWAIIFIGACAVLFFLVLIGLALFNKKTWGDVGMGLGWCAAAGGGAMCARWALGIFTS